MDALLSGILGFFAFGAIGFWLLILILSIVYTCAVELDKHRFAIACTIIAVLLGWNNIAPLFHRWHLLLVGIAVYGVAGGAWSVFRWFRYCRKFVEAHPTSNIHEDTWDHESVTKPARRPKTAQEYYTENLKPAKHKSKLIGWIVYWPWSLVWNFAGDFFTGIYDALANVYSRVSASVIAKATGQ